VIYEQQKGSRDSKEGPVVQIVRMHQHYTNSTMLHTEASIEIYGENCREEEDK
jgi:hypothetical protein